MTRLRRVVAEAWSPPHRWFTLALLTGFVLRLAWVTWVTADPGGALSDTAQNLSMAEQFSRFETYRVNGNLSAYHSAGYPLILAPFVGLARLTGGVSAVYAAALVNVAAGTATIAMGGLLADRWIGRAARAPAAWLLALAVGPIFLTSVALTETVHTALVLGALLGVTAIAQGEGPLERRHLVVLGLLIGFTTLVRTTGAVVLVVALVAVVRRVGSWRGATRPAAALAVAALAILAPWVVRNGVQVGVWAPAGNAAAFLCHGHGDHAEAAEVDLSDETISECFRGTAFGPDPDEGRWYRETTAEAVGWALRHPVEELRLTWDKTLTLYADDSQALADAADFGSRTLAGPTTSTRLDLLADAWHRFVLVAAAAGLAISPAARRAWPLWATVGGLTVAVWAGSVLDRYHHTIMALLAVFAAATLVAVGRWASAGVRDRSEEVTEAEADEPPPLPEEGLAQASRPRSRLGGPGGHPFLPVLLGTATGAWASALAFDAVSFASSTEWVYARGAWLLTGIGVAVGLVASFAALSDLLGIPRGTVAFRVGVRQLLALDAALVLFTASFLVRNASDFAFHDPTPVLAVLLSLLGLAALAVTHWLGGTLTYRYGVRVALDGERVEGFEPADP